MATRSVLVKLLTDATGAKAGLRETSAELKRFGSYTAEATVKLQTQGVQAKLDKLTAQLKRYQEQPHTAEVQIRMGNVARQIERAEAQLAGLGKAGEEAGAKAAGGLRLAGLASDRLSSKLKHHRSEFIGFAKGAVGITAAFSAITDARSAVETTDNLAKATLILGRNFGFTAEEASKWAVVAQSRDVDPTALSTGFTRLSRAVEQARAGSKSYQTTFRQLGITNTDLIRGQRDFPFLIGKVTEAFSHMSGGTRRAAISQQLFGRGSRSLLLLLRQGSQGFDAQAQAAEKYGATLNEKTLGGVEKLVVAQRKAYYATTGLQIAFGTGLAPVLTRVTQRVSAFILGMRNGTGAGGRFASQLRAVWNSAKPVITSLGSVVKVVLRIPHAVAAAAAAWAAYRVAASVSTRITQARVAAAVLGIRRIGPAVAKAEVATVAAMGGMRAAAASTSTTVARIGPAAAEAEAVTVSRFAAMRGAVLSMINPLAAVLAGLVAIQQMKPGGDINSFIANARKRIDAAGARADRQTAASSTLAGGFPDGGAANASGRPASTPAGRRRRGTIQTAAQIVAGLGSDGSVSVANLRLQERQAQRAYVAAVRQHGANSAAAIAAADTFVQSRQAVEDALHPPRTATQRAAAARRRRRRAAAGAAGAANPDATPQDLANEHAAQTYAQIVRKYGAGSPEAIRARDQGNVANVKATIQSITTRLAADLHKYGAGSERVARDRTALARAQVRLTTATQQLTKAVQKGAAQNAALLPRLTDVAYHPISGRMQHTPTRHGLGAAGRPVVNHHEWNVTTPGGVQYPDGQAWSSAMQRLLAAKGNG